ncbi:MAG: hypothetical protein ACR2KT_18250 [Methylocella sp.]|nr:MAG: hypothetical protein DLM68_15730 [Hyphomicrobiales bacterium]
MKVFTHRIYASKKPLENLDLMQFIFLSASSAPAREAARIPLPMLLGSVQRRPASRGRASLQEVEDMPNAPFSFSTR